jgi:hypothetical protein
MQHITCRIRPRWVAQQGGSYKCQGHVTCELTVMSFYSKTHIGPVSQRVSLRILEAEAKVRFKNPCKLLPGIGNGIYEHQSR